MDRNRKRINCLSIVVPRTHNKFGKEKKFKLVILNCKQKYLHGENLYALQAVSFMTSLIFFFFFNYHYRNTHLVNDLLNKLVKINE